MKEVKRNFHTDASHGWLAVPLDELMELGIAKHMSHYSYFKTGIVYLEEDCDAPIYLKAIKAKGDDSIKVVERHSNNQSFIRNLAPFHPEIY